MKDSRSEARREALGTFVLIALVLLVVWGVSFFNLSGGTT